MEPATWSIADAKSKLSEVLNQAEQRPQVITRRDRRYVVVEGETYARLVGERPGLKDLLLDGPSLEGVDLTRGRSGTREVSL